MTDLRRWGQPTAGGMFYSGVYTYFIEDSIVGAVKIGESSDPARRYAAICNEFKKAGDTAIWLRLLGYTRREFLDEARLHELFSDARITHPTIHAGMTEWFSTKDPLVALCVAMLSAGNWAIRDKRITRLEARKDEFSESDRELA